MMSWEERAESGQELLYFLAVSPKSLASPVLQKIHISRPLFCFLTQLFSIPFPLNGAVSNLNQNPSPFPQKVLRDWAGIGWTGGRRANLITILQLKAPFSIQVAQITVAFLPSRHWLELSSWLLLELLGASWETLEFILPPTSIDAHNARLGAAQEAESFWDECCSQWHGVTCITRCMGVAVRYRHQEELAAG